MDLAVKCERCHNGVALVTLADDNGSNYKCGHCGHGFTVPNEAPEKDPREGDPAAVGETPGGGQRIPGSVNPEDVEVV